MLKVTLGHRSCDRVTRRTPKVAIFEVQLIEGRFMQVCLTACWLTIIRSGDVKTRRLMSCPALLHTHRR